MPRKWLIPKYYLALRAALNSALVLCGEEMRVGAKKLPNENDKVRGRRQKQ